MAKVCVVVALSWLPYFTERLSFGCSALSSEIAFIVSTNGLTV